MCGHRYMCKYTQWIWSFTQIIKTLERKVVFKEKLKISFNFWGTGPTHKIRIGERVNHSCQAPRIKRWQVLAHTPIHGLRVKASPLGQRCLLLYHASCAPSVFPRCGCVIQENPFSCQSLEDFQLMVCFIVTCI